jgi:hypothetical protein
MKTNWVHRKINDNPILNLVVTSQRKTYMTVATKGTLPSIGQSEEFKRNLETPESKQNL